MPIIWTQTTAQLRPARVHVDDSTATTLYAHLARSVLPETVPDLLYNQLPGTLRRRIQRVALQVHPGAYDLLAPDHGLVADFCGRLEVDRLDIVTWGPQAREHRIECQYGPGASGPEKPIDEADLVRQLRAADLLYVANMPGARLPDTPHFHYEGPNGHHYTSFLRPGFSLSSLEDLESICFWLAPLVPANSIVVVDTWNIASLGIALVNYAQLGRGSREGGAPLPFACVDSYAADPRALADHIDEVRRATGASEVFFIISISGSGRFARAYQEAFSASRIPATFVSLFATDADVLPTEVTVLQTVADIERFDATHCPRCLDERVKSPVIRVLPRSYLLELSGAVTNTRITETVAAPYRNLFTDTALPPGAISVHREQHDGQRHHAIHFDVTTLLASDGFRRRCREIASRIQSRRIRRILCPDHPGAIALAEFFASQLQVPFTPVDEHDLVERHNTEPLDRLGEERSIAIVDDVVITGHRLQGYQRALHDCGLVAHAEGIDFVYIVGVARPPTQSAMVGLRDMVPGRQLEAAVEVLLPDWQDNDECPWCIERQLLESHPALLERHSTLRDRHDLLCDVDSGLSSELFLRWTGLQQQWETRSRTEADWKSELEWLQEAEPRVRLDLSWDLGPGSVFGAPNELQLYVIVAGAIQTLRSMEELHQDQYESPQAKVLDPYLYLRGRFYDPIVVAAILRASRRHDLRATAIEKLLRRAVGDKLTHGLYGELRAELMLAIGTGKLPRPVELRDDAVFANGDPGVTALLRSLTGGS